MHKLHIAPALLLALVLSACASLTAPQTPAQTVYAAYGSYITVANTTADLLTARIIDVERAKEVQARLNEWRPRLETARRLVGAGQPVDNLALIRAIQAELMALQRRLAKRAQEAAQ